MSDKFILKNQGGELIIGTQERNVALMCHSGFGLTEEDIKYAEKIIEWLNYAQEFKGK